MRSLFSCSSPPKLIHLATGIADSSGEGVQQVRLCSGARSLHPILPVRQDLLEIPFRALQRLDVLSSSLELVLCKFVDPLAWSTPSVTGFQDLCQFCQRETDPKGSLHDKHSLDRVFGIQTVTRFSPRSSRKHSDLFVVPDRVWAYTSRFRESPGMESFLDSRPHEKYQPSNAFQSQGICGQRGEPLLWKRQATIVLNHVMIARM